MSTFDPRPVVGKTYRLASAPDGIAKVLGVDGVLYFGFYAYAEGATKTPVMWDNMGRAFAPGRLHSADLGDEYKEPRRGVRYINIYDNDPPGTAFAHITRDSADRGAKNATGCEDRKRIACVRVDWEEGQFDD